MTTIAIFPQSKMASSVLRSFGRSSLVLSLGPQLARRAFAGTASSSKNFVSRIFDRSIEPATAAHSQKLTSANYVYELQCEGELGSRENSRLFQSCFQDCSSTCLVSCSPRCATGENGRIPRKSVSMLFCVVAPANYTEHFPPIVSKHCTVGANVFPLSLEIQGEDAS